MLEGRAFNPLFYSMFCISRYEVCRAHIMRRKWLSGMSQKVERFFLENDGKKSLLYKCKLEFYS